MRVALVHDFLDRKGGAERVLRELVRLFPDAPVYTLLYDKALVNEWFPKTNVVASSLQHWPKFIRRRRHLLLLAFPVAIEGFDLSGYDLVISSSGAWSKAVITRSSTVHVSYCHSPMRFAWDWYHQYIVEHGWGKFMKLFIYPAMNYIRVWDRVSAQRVDFWIANSQVVARRIKKYYRAHDVSVIYPPVSIQAGDKSILPKETGYFLMVTRLSRYKNVELVIHACQKLGLRLRIVGTGPDELRLKRLESKNVQFLGNVSDAQLSGLYTNACALINASDEDFGLVPVEAMMHGKPVIALKHGGAQETVTPEVGLFFDEPTVESLVSVLAEFKQKQPTFDPEIIKNHAEQFSVQRFDDQFLAYIRRLFE